jgi:hypothetical protein
MPPGVTQLAQLDNVPQHVVRRTGTEDRVRMGRVVAAVVRKGQPDNLQRIRHEPLVVVPLAGQDGQIWVLLALALEGLLELEGHGDDL